MADAGLELVGKISKKYTEFESLLQSSKMKDIKLEYEHAENTRIKEELKSVTSDLQKAKEDVGALAS